MDLLVYLYLSYFFCTKQEYPGSTGNDTISSGSPGSPEINFTSSGEEWASLDSTGNALLSFVSPGSP